MVLRNIFGALCVFFSTSALCGTIQITAQLDSVTLIGPSSFGHSAGNLEIKVTGGFGSAEGVTCDGSYITTKDSVPNFQEILSVLLAAQIAEKTLILGITDDPALTAFGGRCSLVSVGILRN